MGKTGVRKTKREITYEGEAYLTLILVILTNEVQCMPKVWDWYYKWEILRNIFEAAEVSLSK